MWKLLKRTLMTFVMCLCMYSVAAPVMTAHAQTVQQEAETVAEAVTADLGFIPDEEVSCVLKGRKGGMRAYLVRNAVIGLREENINEIFVQTGSATE